MLLRWERPLQTAPLTLQPLTAVSPRVLTPLSIPLSSPLDQGSKFAFHKALYFQ